MTRKHKIQTKAQKRSWLKFRILSFLEFCQNEENADLLTHDELCSLAAVEEIYKHVVKNWRNSL